MIRSWRVWLLVSACLLLALSGVVWLSVVALRLDRADRSSRESATREENVRLALWRLDSDLMPLVARESAVVAEAYLPLFPARGIVDPSRGAVRDGTYWLASPLRSGPPDHVLLHFQMDSAGEVSSPQVPSGAFAAPERRAPDAEVPPEELRRRLEVVTSLLQASDLRRTLSGAPQALARQDQEARMPLGTTTTDRAQASKNVSEFFARSRSARQAARQSVVPNAAWQAPEPPPPGEAPGEMRALWLGESLVLVRRARIHGEEYVQGCWLDWGTLRPWLLERVRDLLPGAVLEPAKGGGEEPGEGRLLAALPLRLVPGAVAQDAGSSGALSSLPLVLTVAWSGVALAGIAVVALLVGVVALSERRGAFVSAVTHELRTPLTTFRMYTEMLAAGMVPDENRRREYFDILHREAERLSHLVENVLAYARIERGRSPAKLERVDVRAVVERMEARLRERAAQVGLTLCVELPSGVMVLTDPAAVEQVLFNLVDNAAKYAANTEDPRVHLELERRGRAVGLAVRDHGPGISSVEARKLFEPFSKSVQAAARSAPGVGLGLALCRRLARSMRGDLRHERVAGRGARFVLWLPVA